MPIRPDPLTLAGRTFVWGERTYVMGAINLTPDSFSGDGLDGNVDAALRRAAAMVEHGADILDIGGESTRPGFTPVDPIDQITRVVPAIRAIVKALDVPVSVDTTHPIVARAAMDVGATIINDTTGLLGDPGIAAAAAASGAAVVAMHNQRAHPYHHHGADDDVVQDICDGWAEALRAADGAGLSRARVIVDPGFGFGWSHTQSLEILRRLSEFAAIGQPLLVGPSRKSTIGVVLDLPVDQRLEGTAAAVALAIANGADLVRVHDVESMSRVARLADAVVRGWSPPDAPRASDTSRG
jgi:dihydropteroate synthase